jgi:ribose-phosphate pyrophosphokinase
MRKSHVFVGSSHPELGKLICDRLGVEQGPCTLRKFSNGETSIEIGVSVRDEDVYIVQSGSDSINDHIMELLIFISGCRSGSANKITAVIPSFPYSKQSKMKKHRGAITARMLANLLTMAGADHVITMDLHATQMQGFFTKPVDNLYAAPTLARWIRHNVPDFLSNAVIVSKNPGGTKRVTALADSLKVNFAMIHTDRRRRQDKPFSRGHSPNVSLISPGLSSNPFTNNHIKPLSLKTVPKSPKTIAPNVPSSLSREISQDDDEDEDETDGEVKVIIDGKNVADEQVKTPNGTEKSDYFTCVNSDDEEVEEVRVIGSHGVHVARVVQGHVVDDDYPEQDDEFNGGSTPSEGTPSMLESIHSHMSEHALGGSGDVHVSDDDEDEHFAKQEKLITLVGDVKGKTAIILDDMIDRHGSFVAAAEHCVINCSAKEVYVVATHGIFSNNSLEELEKCPCINQIVVTNTYPIPLERRKLCKKLTIIDVSPILAECIRRNHHGESISVLFEQQLF